MPRGRWPSPFASGAVSRVAPPPASVRSRGTARRRVCACPAAAGGSGGLGACVEACAFVVSGEDGGARRASSRAGARIRARIRAGQPHWQARGARLRRAARQAGVVQSACWAAHGGQVAAHGRHGSPHRARVGCEMAGATKPTAYSRSHVTCAAVAAAFCLHTDKHDAINMTVRFSPPT